MSITDRDRKVLLILLPVLALAAFWLFLLSPKRDEVAKLGDEVAEQRQEFEAAEQTARQLESVKGDFAREYASVVRLGKAVPSDLGMASLVVQLDAAAKGTDIVFDRISAGERTPAAAAVPADGSTPPGGASADPAAAGGQPAQSAPGKAAESAGNAVNQANADNASKTQLDTKTSESARPGGGGIPVGGGASPATATAAGGTSGAPGLDRVQLELDFTGTFFDLADFFHRMKRFVKVSNNRIEVSGRLITIDGFTLALNGFGGRLKAAMKASVYLVPEQQGVTAGATPAGPAATPAATGAGGTSPTPATPTATVTP